MNINAHQFSPKAQWQWLLLVLERENKKEQREQNHWTIIENGMLKRLVEAIPPPTCQDTRVRNNKKKTKKYTYHSSFGREHKNSLFADAWAIMTGGANLDNQLHTEESKESQR